MSYTQLRDTLMMAGYRGSRETFQFDENEQSITVGAYVFTHDTSFTWRVQRPGSSFDWQGSITSLVSVILASDKEVMYSLLVKDSLCALMALSHERVQALISKLQRIEKIIVE